MLRRLGLIAIMFGVLASVMLPSVRPALAQTDVETGYQSILQNGLIFANMPGSAEEVLGCKSEGKCSVDQVMQIFVNIATGILGIIGSVVLLMFVYGGFIWITSEGRVDRVDTGKKTVVNAVIGLALVLGAYALMTFVIAAITGTPQGQDLNTTVNNAITNPVTK